MTNVAAGYATILRPRIGARRDGTIYEMPQPRPLSLLPKFTAPRGGITFYHPPPVSVIFGEAQMRRAWRRWLWRRR